MNDDARPPSDDDILAAIKTLNRAVKSARLLGLGIVGLVSAVVGLGYNQSIGQRAVERVVATKPGLVRPDPWTGIDDKRAMQSLREWAEREHAQIQHEIDAVLDRLNSGRSREHWRINILERRLEKIEERYGARNGTTRR